MPAVLALIAEVLSLAPQLISAGMDITNLVVKARAALDANAAPSDADWQALDAQVSALHASLNTDPPAA
jgi:hypothetical protein